MRNYDLDFLKKFSLVLVILSGVTLGLIVLAAYLHRAIPPEVSPQAAQRQRGSFRELCEEWYRNEIIGRGIKHPSVPRRHLDNYLLPKLGRTAAADVTAADIARVIDDLKVRAPTAVNDLLRFTRRIFAFGVRRRIVPANPAADFSPRLDGGGTERPRSRALSLDERAQLFAKVSETPTFGTANAVALKLLLALCVRKGELLCARW